MAQSWKYAVLLGLVGVATAAGCTVKEGDDDDIGGFGGESGDAGTGGTSGKGGSAGKGGTGGTAGKGGTAGSAGKGGTGGTAGKGGAAGSGGTTAGSSGEAGGGGEGAEDVVTCDPDEGNLDSTPYPDCEPANDDDECGACIQENCCEESKECYGFEPKNVCGWGGPEGLGEIDCYETCLKEYVTGAEGVCDDEGIFGCLNTCVTDACGAVPGNRTQDLAVCMNSNCSDECFGADSCEE
jgi:hypothetical protein